MKVGQENPFIEALWKNLPADLGQEHAPQGATVDLTQLLPKNRAYYTFTGSLTTPPCSEDVTWLVLKNPVEISKPEEAAFAAKHAHKPLVVHSREAWSDTFRVLDDEGVPERTIFHCFTGGPDEATAALERGCYLSFSGIVSFKNAGALREAARITPDDRVLVETDSPFLTPEPHRGRPNEPALVVAVGDALARARGVAPEEIAEITRVNAVRAFGVER